MPLYEHVFIARQDVSAQQVEQMTDAFKGVLEENGGKITMVENWGIRSLAYKIKKNRKAHYVRLNIDAPHEAVAEMERHMGIHDDVLRTLTIRVDEHDTEPAGLMSSRGGRDDRRGGPGGRGGFGGRDRDDRPRRDFGDRPRRDFGNRDAKPAASTDAKPAASADAKPATSE